jgi:hypothetical protein
VHMLAVMICEAPISLCMLGDSEAWGDGYHFNKSWASHGKIPQ